MPEYNNGFKKMVLTPDAAHILRRAGAAIALASK